VTSAFLNTDHNELNEELLFEIVNQQGPAHRSRSGDDASIRPQVTTPVPICFATHPCPLPRALASAGAQPAASPRFSQMSSTFPPLPLPFSSSHLPPARPGP